MPFNDQDVAEFLDSQSDLFAICVNFCRDTDKAHDLCQETLTKAWAKQNQYKSGTNMRAWLRTIARNTFFDEKRRKGRVVEARKGDIEFVSDFYGQNALFDGDDVIELKKVRERMTRLPLRQQQAIEYIAIMGDSYAEAADKMNSSVTAVKLLVHRARALLAEHVTVDEQRADWRRQDDRRQQAFQM